MDDATQKLVDEANLYVERYGLTATSDLVDRLRAALEAAQRPPVSPEQREALADVVSSAMIRAKTDTPYGVTDAILARFSFPTLDVERLTRWLVENRRLVAGSAWEYVDSEGTAAALVAALPALTKEGSSERSRTTRVEWIE